MRLLNVHTLKLEEFFDECNVSYAILSHRWEDEEVTLHDIQDIERAFRLKGFRKIRKTCQQASKDGIKYAWVDTCCIEKANSAELSEAINSMFRWYQNSKVCYAYLSDVDLELNNFTSSVWFTRGWTLQELIAPSEVYFYDHHWRSLGNRVERKNDLLVRTGIASLSGMSLTEYSIAQRMSWASNRVTTRSEDMAYCLLGIFGVNMPLLYGEGSRAFIRLQEEIMKQVDDQSIFAWPMPSTEPCGLLAPSPKVFENCTKIRPIPSRYGRSAYSMTNRGLKITLRAKPFVRNVYLVQLVCSLDVVAGPAKPLNSYRYALIYLRRRFEDDQYARVSIEGESIIHEVGDDWHLSKVDTFFLDANVRQIQVYSPAYDQDSGLDTLPGFVIDRVPEISFEAREARMIALDDKRLFIKMSIRNKSGVAGEIRLRRGDGLSDIRLLIGHDLDFNPICYVSCPQKGSQERKMPTQMYRCQTWSSHALNKEGEEEFREVEAGTGVWLVKGDRINGLYGQLFRDRASAMVGRITFRDKEISEGVSAWHLRFRFPATPSSYGSKNQGPELTEMQKALPVIRKM